MPSPISDYIPQCAMRPDPARRRATFVAWGIAAVGSLVFLSLVALAPVALARGHSFLSQVIYKSFSLLCHQMAERSFHVEGHPLAVCARCFGLYAGFAAGVLLYPLLRDVERAGAPARVWLFAAVVPTSVDFMLGFLGIWENTHLSRSVTGALLGTAAAFFVVPGLADVCQMRRRHFQTRTLVRG